jgi:hypothetical protein
MAKTTSHVWALFWKQNNRDTKGNRMDKFVYSTKAKAEVAKRETALEYGGGAAFKSILVRKIGYPTYAPDLNKIKNPSLHISSGGGEGGWQAAHAFRQLPDGRVQILTNPKGKIPKIKAENNPEEMSLYAISANEWASKAYWDGFNKYKSANNLKPGFSGLSNAAFKAADKAGLRAMKAEAIKRGIKIVK